MKKIVIIVGFLGYNLFFKLKSIVVFIGIRRFLNYNIFLILVFVMFVLKNGINLFIKNKRFNVDILSLSVIISSIFFGKESVVFIIMFLEEVLEFLIVYIMEKICGVIKDMLSVGENYVWKEILEDNVKRVFIEEI